MEGFVPGILAFDEEAEKDEASFEEVIQEAFKANKKEIGSHANCVDFLKVINHEDVFGHDFVLDSIESIFPGFKSSDVAFAAFFNCFEIWHDEDEVFSKISDVLTYLADYGDDSWDEFEELEGWAINFEV